MAEKKKLEPKKIMREKESEKKSIKSLAEELKERLLSDELEEERIIGKKLDISDKEVEEISKKISHKDVEEEKKSINARDETLIPLEDYIKCAVHLGTKVITPHMRKFVYKRRAD